MSSASPATLGNAAISGAASVVGTAAGGIVSNRPLGSSKSPMRPDMKGFAGIAPTCPVACSALLVRISASWLGMSPTAPFTWSMNALLSGR